MLCHTLTGLFRKSASQPAHGPPVHPSDSGKAVLPSLPGSSPLPSSRKSHTTQAAPAAWTSCTSPRAGIVRFHPFFQIIRPAAVERPVRTFQKICVVHLSFSISLLYRHLPAACHGIPESGPITDYVNGNGTMESIAVLRKQSLRNLYESIGMP